MNFAYVRLHGRVVDYPSLSTTDGYLSFQVLDESGDIRVAAYHGTVEGLLAQHRIPMPGTIVTVEGTLRVRDDGPSLTLNSAEMLDSSMPEAVTATLGNLDAFDLGDRIISTGQVRRVREAGNQYRILTLRDGATEADVMIPLQLGNAPDTANTPGVGMWVRVIGSVNEYRARREVLVNSSTDITIVPTQPLETHPISALNTGMVGKWLAVDAVVQKLRPITGGMLVDLKDSSGGAVTAVLYDLWFQTPLSTTLGIGSAVFVQGELVNYQGHLELRPELSFDLVEHQ